MYTVYNVKQKQGLWNSAAQEGHEGSSPHLFKALSSFSTL